MVPSGNLINIETPNDNIQLTSRPPAIDTKDLAQVQIGELDESTIFDLNLASKNDQRAFSDAKSNSTFMRLERPEARRSSPSRFRTDKTDHDDFGFLMNASTTKREDDPRPEHDEPLLKELDDATKGARSNSPKERSTSRGRSYSRGRTSGDYKTDQDFQRNMDDYYPPTNDHVTPMGGGGTIGFENTNDLRRTILGGVSSIKSEVPDPVLPTEDCMSEEQCNQLKLQYLSEYRRKNTNYEYSSKLLSMDDSLSTIKRELDFVRREKNKEGGKKVMKKGLGIAAQGIVMLNNLYQPFGVTMDHWRNQFDQELNVNNDYDEMIEELVQSYGDRLSLPVEVKLAIALSTSFACGVFAAREEKRLVQQILQKEQERKEELAQKEMMEAAANLGKHQGTYKKSNATNPLKAMFGMNAPRTNSPVPMIQLTGPSRSADEMRQLLQDQFMEESEYQPSEVGDHDIDTDMVTSVNMPNDDRTEQTTSEIKRRPGRPKGSKKKPKSHEQASVEITVPIGVGA